MNKLKDTLENIGQTFFIPHWKMGTLVLGALLLSNPLLIPYSLLCLLTCHQTMKLMKGNQILTLKGFVDVNALFTGASIGYFFEPNIQSLGLCLLAGCFVAYLIILIQRLLSPWQLSILILPFLSVFQIFWILKDYSPLLHLQKHELITTSLDNTDFYFKYLNLEGSLRSVSQIFFSNSLILSAIVLLGILFISRKLLQVVLFSSILSTILASSFGFSSLEIHNGFIGFNSVLVASAYLGLENNFRWLKLLLLVSLTTFLVPVTNILLGRMGLLSMSLPYVITIWSLQLTKSRTLNATPAATKKNNWLIQSL